MTVFCQYVFLNNSKNHKKGDTCNRRLRVNKKNSSETFCWEHCNTVIPKCGSKEIIQHVKTEEKEKEKGKEKEYDIMTINTKTKKPMIELNFIELKNSI